jgi:DNA-directed RNA polymerase specialized sigma24 family protein
MSLGFPAEAKRHLRRGLALREAVFGERHLEVAKAKKGLATLHGNVGERVAAEALLREVLARRPTEPLDTAVAPAPPDNAEDLWDREWRDALVAECLNQIRTEVQPVTYAAFQLFALEEHPARHVADELGLSENAVSLAKSRILRRLRDLMPLMEEIW